MRGYRNKSQKSASGGAFRSLLKKPWIFAGAALGLDIAMLVCGMVLSTVQFQVEYTLVDKAVERSQPLAFFGVIAAAVTGVVCVLTAFIIAGAFLKKRHGIQILGAAALLILSLVMVGMSTATAMGMPSKQRKCVAFTDEQYSLIIEEEQPYYGTGKVTFFLTDANGTGTLRLLGSTDISEYSTSDDRYTVNWATDNILVVGFTDGANYRTIQMNVEK